MFDGRPRLSEASNFARPLTDTGASRYFIMVSGAPGAGKTTLAVTLAASLSLPLFSKDLIKETLADTLGGPTADLGYSRRLGAAAMEVLWRLARHAPAAVIEANFRPRSEYERRHLEALNGRLVEVYCDCPSSEVARRFAERAASAHPAHPLAELPPELLAEYDGPVGLGVVIRVDTTAPADVAALVARIEQALASSSTITTAPAARA